ncbi:MAG: hypothetical protein NZ750_12970 [Anaerolineae bacterium]|nr:hypothetical protein [Anaerolineae bacterium]MDW8173688.1 hypothetical protein [Anaerolineae bacterium]
MMTPPHDTLSQLNDDQRALLLWLLDVIEPLGLLASQALWCAAPFAAALGQRRGLAQLAEALETAEGRAALRHCLSAADSSADEAAL